LGVAGRNYPGPGLKREEELSSLTTAVISGTTSLLKAEDEHRIEMTRIKVERRS
jgi:hypothetical protein